MHGFRFLIVIVFISSAGSALAQTTNSDSNQPGIKMQNFPLSFYEPDRSGVEIRKTIGATYGMPAYSNYIHPELRLPQSGKSNHALYLPPYTQGIFCDFEDHLNRNRKFRIDFAVK